MPDTVFRVGPKDRGKRLDHFLRERIPALSRNWVQRAIGQRVSVSWTPPLEEEPLDLRLPILARGPGWMAVDKPAGVPVHPVNRVRENSLIHLLRRQEDDDRLRLVHRLDRESFEIFPPGIGQATLVDPILVLGGLG